MVKEELEQEWLDLMLEARDLGISIDEIRDFLQQS
ncbi:anti-repressor SinI family protein [Bacillus sp. FJAT-29814]|nr:anti-repressor SinI family protein [Bacillus sp. FJAT-29814]